MRRIALATSANYSSLTDDDRLLFSPLAERDFEAEPAVWDDPAYPWSSCDAVVIRSCWDYHLKPDEFLGWLASLDTASVPVFNSSKLVRWNTNKSYLRELEARGITVIPTMWNEGGEKVNLAERLRELSWEKAVIKPCISATAHRTQLVSAEQAACAQPLFNRLQDGVGVMVQRFVEGIVEQGEWSLIFFGGRFSHAVLKIPKAGDFRVQHDFGGLSRVADPPLLVLEAGVRAVEAAGPTVYARVDGIVEDGQFLLMELELIEPGLFLSDHPEAPGRFVEAIAAAVVSAGK